MAGSNSHHLIAGDARSLSMLEDGSVHLVVTSPPYWQLKDYGHDHQIGFDQSFGEYIDHLNLVWAECYRVLHPGCRLCLNVGDQFARAAYYGRYKLLSIQSEIIRFLETLGADYMGTIIWQKVTSTRTSGGASIMGSFPYPRNGMAKIDYEHILLFKKLGKAPKPTAAQKEQAKLTTEEWNRFFAGHWTIPGAKQDRHIAAFPEEIPHRLIRMFSFPGETVLEPFAGSGTTLVAGAKLGRRGVGVEIVSEYVDLAAERVAEAAGEPILVSSAPTLSDRNLNEKLAALPYRVSADGPTRVIDPRMRTFGSRIQRQQ